MSVVALSAQGRVIVRVPRDALGISSDPTTWRVAVALMSQDGYPSAGVDRVRDVQPVAAQWKIGGGSGAVNDTRIVDLLDPQAGAQEAQLSARPPSAVTQADLTADDVATIALLP
jgi:carbohydrate-binding DOMON domain-containing protein